MTWLATVLFAFLSSTHAYDDTIKYDAVAVKRFEDELRRLGVALPSVSTPDEPISCPDPIVSSPAGDFEGYWTTSQFGRPIAAFEGIPYAQPPIGPLRFKVAQPLRSSLSNYKAKDPRSACAQANVFSQDGGTAGSEDCLYLNIYVPEKIQRAENERLPVIVYVHGGDFVYGSKDFYRSGVLLDKDVIFVAMNYRLGPFGFLTTGDNVIPGNIGLKDQLAAFHWVRDNIAAFGGEPNLITASGHSTGAACAEFLSISPLAKGLIHRVLPISGSAMAPWALAPPDEPKERVRSAARNLDCPAEPSVDLLACLQTKTTEELIATEHVFNEYAVGLFIPFKPVVEGDIPGALLPYHPKKLYADLANDVPYMTGILSDEGALWSSGLFGNATLLQDFDQRFNEVVSPVLYLREPHQKSQASTETLRKAYFSDLRPMQKSQVLEGANLLTDQYFLLPMIESEQYRREGSKYPAHYIWYFSYQGSRSIMKQLLGLAENIGVAHGDDLFYILSLGNFSLTAEDAYMSMIMTDLYASFARDGVPSSKLLRSQWKPVTTKGTDIEYLHIRSPMNIKMEKDLLPERWNLMKTIMEKGG